VEARNLRSEDLDSLGDVYVTLGPRVLIEQFGELLEKRLANSRLVDPLTFRDTAFPEGGWSLTELISPALCKHVRETLSVRYAVLLEAGPRMEPDRERSVFFGIGVSGYHTEESALSAIIVDLGSSELICRVASSASGKELFLVTWAGGYATDPITESAVLTGLSDSVAEVLMEQDTAEPLAFTVLAVEPLYMQ
jgi:hypothetical protein